MIESVIALVQQSSSPSSGDDLLGFVMDVEAAFEYFAAFKETNITTSSNPSCLVQVNALVAPSVSSVQQIGDVLAKVWDEIGYPHFKASAVTWYREAAVLRFVTVISDESLYITGMVVASSPQYPQLVKRCDADFGSLCGRLKPYPGGLPDWARQLV